MARKYRYVDSETGIWSLEVAKKRHRFDKRLAKAIGELYNPKLVADVGCGNGIYCRYLTDNFNWKVHGYEGTKDITSLGVYDDIMYIDLSVRRYVGIEYDLVICLEVGEHIPKQYEQVFMDNVRDFTHKDLILSWAIPNQGGFGHFNEQPREYIINEFINRGLRLDSDKTNYLKERSSLRWFKSTLMAFVVKE